MSKFSCVAVLLTLSTLAGPAVATEVAISETARAHFEAGVSLMQDPDGARHEEAYREFKAAYAASPSWKILGNLGIAAMKLERDGEALIAFERYLLEGGDELDSAERAQLQRDLATLRAGVCRLKLDAGAGTVLDERFTASGAVVQNAYNATELAQPLGVRAGRHRFTARSAGQPDVVWEVELTPKQEASHRFVPASAEVPSEARAVTPAAAERGNPMRTGAFVALGVGVVGLGVGTFFSFRSKQAYDDGNALCPSFPCPLSAAKRDERDGYGQDGDSAKALAIAGFAVGGVGLATGVTLLVLGSRRSSEQGAIEPYVGVGAAGIKGSF